MIPSSTGQAVIYMFGVVACGTLFRLGWELGGALWRVFG
jgi:hypothetical protein